MNPFYTHSHNHHHLAASMSQFTTNSTSPPAAAAAAAVLNTIPHHFQQQQQQQPQSNQTHNSLTQHQFQTQSQVQVQNGSVNNTVNNPSSAALVSAAAQFYARSSQDQFSRRLQQTVGNSMAPTNSTSPSTSPTIFGGIEDTLFARAEALADISKASHHHMQQAAVVAAAKQQDNLYMAAAAAVNSHTSPLSNHIHQINRHSFDNNNNESERASSTSSIYHHHHHHHQPNNSLVESNTNPFYNAFYASHHHHPTLNSPSTHQISQHASAAIAAAAAAAASIHHNEIDIDPRELETFAEKFKQRRIKLGVTQADVGQQLSKLKLPGVGSLSQSTICRFESLTLSHNNMIALKPVLHSWLEQAEADARNKKKNEESMSGSSSISNSQLSSSSSLMSNLSTHPNTNPNPNNNHNINTSHLIQTSHSNRDLADRKRKRTSIAAPEKRSLEAFFSVQPRPSGEKIAQIAEKLDLKKNVVRVWFCNQRQKQKRMKFAAIQGR